MLKSVIKWICETIVTLYIWWERLCFLSYAALYKHCLLLSRSILTVLFTGCNNSVYGNQTSQIWVRFNCLTALEIESSHDSSCPNTVLWIFKLPAFINTVYFERTIAKRYYTLSSLTWDIMIFWPQASLTTGASQYTLYCTHNLHSNCGRHRGSNCHWLLKNELGYYTTRSKAIVDFR